MEYKDSQTRMFLCTGKNLEWVNLHFSFERDVKKGDILGLRLTRRMAWALMKEIEGRLFMPKAVDTCGVITETKEDYCFNLPTESKAKEKKGIEADNLKKQIKKIEKANHKEL